MKLKVTMEFDVKKVERDISRDQTGVSGFAVQDSDGMNLLIATTVRNAVDDLRGMIEEGALNEFTIDVIDVIGGDA